MPVGQYIDFVTSGSDFPNNPPYIGFRFYNSTEGYTFTWTGLRWESDLQDLVLPWGQEATIVRPSTGSVQDVFYSSCPSLVNNIYYKEVLFTFSGSTTYNSGNWWKGRVTMYNYTSGTNSLYWDGTFKEHHAPSSNNVDTVPIGSVLDPFAATAIGFGGLKMGSPGSWYAHPPIVKYQVICYKKGLTATFSGGASPYLGIADSGHDLLWSVPDQFGITASGKAYSVNRRTLSFWYTDVGCINYTISVKTTGYYAAADYALANIIVRFVNPGNFIYLQLYNGRLTWVKVQNGIHTGLISSASTTSLTNLTEYQLYLTVNGNLLAATIAETPSSAVSYTLTGTEITIFNQSLARRVGGMLNIAPTAATSSIPTWDDFIVTPL